MNDAAAVRLPPPLVFVALAIVGALFDRFVYRLTYPVEGYLRLIVGVGAIVASVALVAFAMVAFRRIDQDPKPWTPTPAIVTEGIYGLSRNPMYVAMALFQVGIAVLLRSGWILLLVPVAMAVVHVTAIRHEEAYLEAKFGDAYREYRRRVRRWL